MDANKFNDLNVTSLWFEVLNGYSDANLLLLLQTIQKRYMHLGSAPNFPFPGRPTLKRLIIILGAVSEQQRSLNIGIVMCDLIHRLIHLEDILQELIYKGLTEALLTLIGSLTDNMNGLSRNKSLQFQLLEDSLKLLLRMCSVGRNNSILLDVFLTENAATTMLDVIDNETSCVFQYSPEASKHLKSLTCGKTLIGQRVRLDSAVMKNKYRQYFGKHHEQVTVPSIGYAVTLFDTTDPDEDVVISRAMLDSKLVWPEDESSEAVVVHPTVNWVDVSVQAAFGGTWFWARFPDDDSSAEMEKIDSALRGFFADNPPQTLKHPPLVGSFVCGTRMGVGVYRAQVVSIRGAVAMVFAFDHGLSFEEPWHEFVYVTRELDLKVAPQAVLCQLQGVRPAAYSERLVTDAIGVLCNLTSHAKPTVLKMPRCACLVPLCRCPRPKISTLAFRLLSNLALCLCQRVYLATPFINVVLGVCQRYLDRLREPEISGVLEAALALLANLIYNCPENIHKLVKLNALEVLLTLATDTTPYAVREAALKVMRCYVGDGKPPRNVTGDRRRPNRRAQSCQRSARSDSDVRLRRQSTPQDARSGQRSSRSSQRTVRTSPQSDCGGPRRSNSDRRHASDCGGPRRRNSDGPRRTRSVSRTRHSDEGTFQAVAKINDNQDSSSDDGLRSPKHDPSDSLLSSLRTGSGEQDKGPSKTRYINMADLCASHTRYFIQNAIVDIKDDETHELRPDIRLELVSANSIASITCSFLNTGKGGTIYFGLRKIPAPISTRARGIKASRDQRDSFRMGVDKDVMGNISPTVTATYYDITFVPVVTATPTADEAAALSDLFVIEFTVKPIIGSSFMTKNKYYLRQGDKSVCLHTQQKIHEELIKKREMIYLDELASLRLELNHLKKLAIHRNSLNKPSTTHVTSVCQGQTNGTTPNGSMAEE